MRTAHGVERSLAPAAAAYGGPATAPAGLGIIEIGIQPRRASG